MRHAVKIMRLRLGLAALLLSAALFPVPAMAAELPPDMPGGVYKLDPLHTSVTFKIDHLGFSHFTGRFDKVAGQLVLDPAAPENSTLEVAIVPGSVDTNDAELDQDLCGENWFDTLKYPQAGFKATGIRMESGHAFIDGDFTLHGVTHHLTLDTVLVGAGDDPMTGAKVIGISAHGGFDRSAYGVPNLEPFVGDHVDLQIESEFDKEPE
jgi:polyisoprenoid-binding protein YceI